MPRSSTKREKRRRSTNDRRVIGKRNGSSHLGFCLQVRRQRSLELSRDGDSFPRDVDLEDFNLHHVADRHDIAGVFDVGVR